MLRRASLSALFAFSCITSGCGSRSPLEAIADSGTPNDCGAHVTASLGAIPTQEPLLGITGTGPGDIWIAAPSALWHWDGSRWTSMPTPAAGGLLPNATSEVWTGAPNDLWFSNANIKCCVWHWSGGAWTSYPLNDNRQVFHLWGSGPSDVFGSDAGDGVHPGYTGHWDGTAWTHIDSGGAGPMWGSGPRDVFSVSVTSVTHYDGSTWSLGPALAAPKYAIAGTAHDDVWIVGDGAMHYDGASWSSDVALPTSAPMRGAWSACKNDVWAAGDGGAITRFDGARWSAVSSPTSAALHAVWGSSPSDVWAVGDQGTVVRFAP
jgi:hypothetical protein